MPINITSKKIKVVQADDLAVWARGYLGIENLYVCEENGFKKREGNEFVCVVDNDYRLTKEELRSSLEMHYNDHWVSCVAVIACALEEKEIKEYDQYVVVKDDAGCPFE